MPIYKSRCIVSLTTSNVLIVLVTIRREEKYEIQERTELNCFRKQASDRAGMVIE